MSSNKLRILVPIKRVLDYQLKPRINKTNDGIITTGVKFSINPFCDIAVEEAVRIREKNADLVDTVHAVSIGPLKSQDILRSSMAKGIDSSTLIETSEKDRELEPLIIAKILKKIVEKNNSNLIILGKQSIDDDSNQTGQMLAGLLNWPQATNAAKVELNPSDNSINITREIDGGEDIVNAKLPLIITTDLRLNEPRFATLPNIMKAKKKPLEKLKVGELGINLENKLKILKIEEPVQKQPGIKVSSVDELIEKLQEKKLL
ncbi:Cir1p [Ascoidea rubescens DSM 1968]|uniref:Probable electron transfer flavoprotein subunit beta n=1 Tax=Ascoidea rubescens DSM 1968 TaxID=1344418 RepID=A0A1D2VP26_9ASCO|nr:electron transfer flavo protein, beta subunit [Ascoidea rubescens DSM 1968]ODV63305.1 electron transfer flavo protein, beta subunit [Ascoidea rubescens DSM 1968]